MADAQTRAETQPTVVILAFASNLDRMMSEMFNLEGYRVIIRRGACEVLGIVERDGGRYVVLMDNYHVNEQARRLLEQVGAHPELRTRMRMVGLAAHRWEHIMGFDEYVKLPFRVADLLDPVERLGAEMETEE